MSKTEWEMHYYSPRTWLLSDGTTIQEPNLQVTTGGRRVRTHEDKPISAGYDRDRDVAFTSVVRAATERNLLVVCEAHTEAELKSWVTSAYHSSLFDEAPQLHLTADATNRKAGAPVAYHATTFWSTWEHPTLPIWFMSLTELNTRRYGQAECNQMLWSPVLYPSVGARPDEKGVLPAPNRGALIVKLGHGQVHTPILSNLTQYWNEKGSAAAEVLSWRAQLGHDSVREALRDLILKVSREADEVELVIPDVWWAMEKAYLNHDFVPTVDHQGNEDRCVTLTKSKTNWNIDRVEGFKEYVSGEGAARKALELYQQMRRELSTVGIVMGELGERNFFSLLMGETKAIPVEVKSELHDPNPYGGGRRGHHMVVDLVSGAIEIGCELSVESALPTHAIAAWEEARTMAALTGRDDDLLASTHTYNEAAVRVAVLERALARRK